MKWQILAVMAFALGYATRGVIDAAGWAWWVAFLLYIPLGAMTWRWARQAAKKAKPTPAPLFGPGALLGNVHENPYMPRDQVIFAHPDLLQKLIRDAGPMLFNAPRINDNRHLPGCIKRHNPMAVCICGERGFGTWKSEFLTPTCPEEWNSSTICPFDDNRAVHKCAKAETHREKPEDVNHACGCGETRSA